MASKAADRLTAAYRARLEAIRTEVTRQLEALYGDSVDPAEIAVSFELFVAKAAPVVGAGQAATARLAAAFLRAYSLARTGDLLEVVSDDEIVGTTREGKPLADGMAAMGSMVLARIGEGTSVEDAIAFGLYLATSFGDNELTGTADRVIDATAGATGRVTGWQGIVSPDACDLCQANAGDHANAEPIYRHPNCGCSQIPLIGEAS